MLESKRSVRGEQGLGKVGSANEESMCLRLEVEFLVLAVLVDSLDPIKV